MHPQRTAILVATAAAFLLPVTASAATMAAATTDLNIRSGPGPEYGVVGVIKENQQATIEGCIEGSLWCRVTVNGRQGWAYSKYMTATSNGQRVVLADSYTTLGVPAVTYDRPGRVVDTIGSAAPASPISGALIPTGPNTPVVVTPPQPVATYVTGNPVDPVMLEGEVVLGAGLPETVTLRPVPGYDYQYAYVNQVPVLVAPSTRRIVYIYR